MEFTFFMAIPVILAESIAISELYLLWNPLNSRALAGFNRICGILAGIAFTIIIIYFIPNIIWPLMKSNGWRTWVDVVAIFSYVLSGIPMVIIALMNVGILFPRDEQKSKQRTKIFLLSIFLVLSHIAMIFGMVDPTVASWSIDSDMQSGKPGMHEAMGHEHPSHK